MAERIAGDTDETCGDCGGIVHHYSARGGEFDHLPGGKTADYFVQCQNVSCKNHVGAAVGDMECPGWAHGEKVTG